MATITTNNTLRCFFCGRDLSQAMTITYASEGPVCSMCLAKINGAYIPGSCPMCGKIYCNHTCSANFIEYGG